MASALFANAPAVVDVQLLQGPILPLFEFNYTICVYRYGIIAITLLRNRKLLAHCDSSFHRSRRICRFINVRLE